MRKPVQMALAVLLVALAVVLVCQGLREREPVYQGRRLSQWLDEYNHVGTLDQTEPISEAIRAIGTNGLPFLLAHVEHVDSPIKEKLLALVGKQHLVKLPFYGEMIKMLDHSEAAVRRASADAIGLYTRPPYAGVARSAVPSLVKALNDADPDVRQSAGRTLQKIDPEAAAQVGVK